MSATAHLSFDEAITRVRAAADPAIAAYATLPFAPRGRPVGTTIWAITFDDDAEAGDDPVWVNVVSGAAHDITLESDGYLPTDAPDEARGLVYTLTTTFDTGVFGSYDPQITLRTLQGEDLDAVLEEIGGDDDTAMRPLVSHGLVGLHDDALDDEHDGYSDLDANRVLPETPRALGELLLTSAVPAAWLPTSSGRGHTPVLVAILAQDDPRGDLLGDLFGGFFIDLVDNDVTGLDAGMYWVGLGFGAAKAARLIEAVLPASAAARRMPVAMRDAWRTWIEFTDAAVGAPADAAGKRPQAVFQNLRRLATRLERDTERALEFYPTLRTVVRRALEKEHRAGATQDALVLPTATELAALVPVAELDADLGALYEPPATG